MLITPEMVAALVRKRYDKAHHPPEWANPILKINAFECLFSTALLHPRQLGLLMRHLCYAALAGDVAECMAWPFVDGVKRGPLGEYRPGLPSMMRRAVIDRDGAICRRCGSTDDLQIDHIKPWALGGRHELSNLQVLCGTCNRKKGPKPHFDRGVA